MNSDCVNTRSVTMSQSNDHHNQDPLFIIEQKYYISINAKA